MTTITSTEILKFISDNSPVSYSRIAQHFRVQDERISVQMKRLRQEGLIQRITPMGSGPLYIVTLRGSTKLTGKSA